MGGSCFYHYHLMMNTTIHIYISHSLKVNQNLINRFYRL